MLGIKNPLPHLPHLSERLLKEQAIARLWRSSESGESQQVGSLLPLFFESLQTLGARVEILPGLDAWILKWQDPIAIDGRLHAEGILIQRLQLFGF